MTEGSVETLLRGLRGIGPAASTHECELLASTLLTRGPQDLRETLRVAVDGHADILFKLVDDAGEPELGFVALDLLTAVGRLGRIP